MNTIFWTSLYLMLPLAALGKCTCDDEPRDGSLALNYKGAAIASILMAGLIGVCLPVAGNWVPALRPESNFFFLMKTFAGGVILATGFIHILPDAFNSLTSPCISESPWRDFPFTGFIAMIAAIGTLTVDSYATSYYRRRSGVNSEGAGDVPNEENEDSGHAHGEHGHAYGAVTESEEIGLRAAETELEEIGMHPAVTESNEIGLHGAVTESNESKLLRHRVISQVLELGIIVHSVINGIALGASENPATIKPLIGALAFHQFFEGLGLGGCIAQARYNTRTVVIMALFFALTTPSGIAIGIGITHIYSETSPTAIIVQGVLNSASAGILIYMALVDLLAADFMSPRLQGNGRLQLGANLSVLLGAGLMALVAKWA